MKTITTFIFSGRVQGVGFRWHAQRFGQQLGLLGWVKNLPDGTVAAEVEGDLVQVAKWLTLLQEKFEISQVHQQEKPYQKVHSVFAILR